MQIDVDSPLDPSVLEAARDFYRALPDLDPGQAVKRLYLHWPAGGYSDCDGAYNASTVLQNGAWRMILTHNPKCNAHQVEPGDCYAAHTWHRNSWALGLAIDGMASGAPIQEHELEVFLGMVAATARRYGVDTVGRAENGEPLVMTHAEAAIADGYWPDRVDLAALPPDYDYTTEKAHATAELLRARIHRYAEAVQ
jgi:hypothetical protein